MKRIFILSAMLFCSSTFATEAKLTCGWHTRDLNVDGKSYSVLLTSSEVDSISFETTYPPFIKMHIIGRLVEGGILQRDKVELDISYTDKLNATFNPPMVTLTRNNWAETLFSVHTYGKNGSQWLMVKCEVEMD